MKRRLGESLGERKKKGDLASCNSFWICTGIIKVFPSWKQYGEVPLAPTLLGERVVPRVWQWVSIGELGMNERSLLCFIEGCCSHLQ